MLGRVILWLRALLEPAGNQSPCAEEPRGHGSLGHAQRMGSLAIGQAHYVDRNEGGPEVFGQARDRGIELANLQCMLWFPLGKRIDEVGFP
jgi:hypothetical protein